MSSDRIPILDRWFPQIILKHSHCWFFSLMYQTFPSLDIVGGQCFCYGLPRLKIIIPKLYYLQYSLVPRQHSLDAESEKRTSETRTVDAAELEAFIVHHQGSFIPNPHRWANRMDTSLLDPRFRAKAMHTQ